MSYGYSQRLIEANKKADAKSLGVPVAELAERLDVSRATVYNWFWGLRTPDRKRSAAIERLLAKLKRT
jgi:transposase